MQEGVDGKWDGIRGPVNTREELRMYDPMAYALMKKLYPDALLPAPWDHNVDRFDISGAPRQEMRHYDLGPAKFKWEFLK